MNNFQILILKSFKIALQFVLHTFSLGIAWQNDEAPVSLMEMRFYIPSSESAADDPVEAFQQQVMQKASVISATGDAIAIFREIQCLTPRYCKIHYSLKILIIDRSFSRLNSLIRYNIWLFHYYYSCIGSDLN